MKSVFEDSSVLPICTYILHIGQSFEFDGSTYLDELPDVCSDSTSACFKKIKMLCLSKGIHAS